MSDDPEVILAPTLPILPDPSLFTSAALSSDTPAYLLVSQAKQNNSKLQNLRDDILEGRYDFSLTPPTNTTLNPLPPIPVPQQHLQSLRRPSISTASTSSKPIERPEIPISHPLDGLSSIEDILKAFNESDEARLNDSSNDRNAKGKSRATGSQWKAESRYNGSAVCIQLGDQGCYCTVWALLTENQGEEDEHGDGIAKTGSISMVRIFMPSPGSKVAHIPDLSSPGYNSALSKHLTDLSLTLSELLYRIPSLPSLLSQPCHYCSKYLHMPDGMPWQHTGWLAERPKRRRSHISPTHDNSGTDDGGESLGRWVAWHDACGSY